MMEADVLSADDVRELVPWLRGTAIAGGLWGPRDGRIDGPAYCRIMAVRPWLAARAIRTGERVIEALSRAIGVADRDERRRGRCDVVVNAAGPWAAQIGGLLGVAVPVIPLRNQIGIWRLTDPLDRMLPMVMDYIPHSGTRGLYVATYDDAEHVLAGLHSEEVVGEGVDPDAYDREPTPSTSRTRDSRSKAECLTCRSARSNGRGPGSTLSARTACRSSARHPATRASSSP